MTSLKQLPDTFNKWDVADHKYDLRDTDLRGVDLSGVTMIGQLFTGSDLRGASLAGAALMFADFTGAKLDGVKLEDEVFGHAILTNATGDGDVIVSYGERPHRIVFTEEVLCVGGRQHTIESWHNFSHERLQFELGPESTRWWHLNKAEVFSRIEAKHGPRHY